MSIQNQFVVVPATYRKTGVTRWDGNPFIEALPELETTKTAIYERLQFYPPMPTNADRRKGEIVRMAELSNLNDLVFPFAEYRRAGTDLTVNLREAYASRNPLTVEDKQRRYAIRREEGSPVPFPTGWKSTAQGQSLLGPSGTGKTTFSFAFVRPYMTVIQHTGYGDQNLKCQQIPVVPLRMPHDASLKSLCLQFFQVIDAALQNGGHYAKLAMRINTVAQMVLQMRDVVTALSVGLAVVDEMQNLRAARTGHVDHLLNLLSDLLEMAGVSLLTIATPALEKVVNANLRNLRKLNSGGESRLGVLQLNDPEYILFQDKIWEYQLVKTKRRLTKAIREAWYLSCAGNPAFTKMSFLLANRQSIGGEECLDEHSFERVANTSMIALQPAIKALLSNDPKAILDFEDLVFTDSTTDIAAAVGWSKPEPDKTPIKEFEDVQDPQDPDSSSTANSKEKRSPRGKSPVDTTGLPIENPLQRD